MKKKKQSFTAKRLTLDALMVAMYVCLSTLLVIPLGGLKLTMEPLPVVVCAVAFGPVDAMIVGFLGELLNQLLTFGFTPTTLLWIAPIVLRAAVIGCSVRLMNHRLSADALVEAKRSVLFMAVCIVAGVLHSCVNTFALYVDSKMFGYYSYAMVFGVFWIRILSGVVAAVLMALITVPLVAALRRAGVLPRPYLRNADEAVAYIHSVNWKGAPPTLERARDLLRRMGNPEKQLKYVHIAGTNGKGSTAAMTAAILQKAGYRTGLFTSPYIYRFHERMQVNGEQISDRELTDIVNFVRPKASKMKQPPTEFDLVSCIAFEYFRRQKCDIVVLEVGMGGELDSTNVIGTPEAAVITNIGLDHTEYLGDTVEKIAQTKAGIIKPGCHAVVYRGTEGVEEVYERVCAERGCVLHKADFDSIRLHSHDLFGQRFDCGDRKDLALPLLGDHQLHNAAVVLSVIDALTEQGWSISEQNIRDGLADVQWPGRFDIVCRQPLFIIDGGHNPQCIEALVKNIDDYLAGRKVIALTGVLADKDYGEMFRPVMDKVDAFVCITPNNPRRLPAEDLAEHLRKAGAKAEACETVKEAVEKAKALAGEAGAVLCFGSLYAIGDIKAAL